MRLFDLGETGWMESQLVYHALASAGVEAVAVQRPSETYVCLGRFNTPGELDTEFLEREDIPVFRREIGGGTVLLDREQAFYHVVADVRKKEVPARVDRFYRYALEPVIETFRDFGLDVSYRPANDLVVDGKKASGNGAGSFGRHYVLAGSVLLDFDTELMTRVLDFPGDGFRERAKELMDRRLTTLRREVGDVSYDEVRDRLVANFETAYGEMEVETELPAEVREEVDRLRERYGSAEWMAMEGKQPRLHDLKVAEGCYLAHCEVEGYEVLAQRSDDAVTWVRVRNGEGRMRDVEEGLVGAGLDGEEILRLLPGDMSRGTRKHVAERVTGGT